MQAFRRCSDAYADVSIGIQHRDAARVIGREREVAGARAVHCAGGRPKLRGQGVAVYLQFLAACQWNKTHAYVSVVEDGETGCAIGLQTHAVAGVVDVDGTQRSDEVAGAEDVAADVEAFGGQNADAHEASVGAEVEDGDAGGALILQQHIGAGAGVIEYTRCGRYGLGNGIAHADCK